MPFLTHNGLGLMIKGYSRSLGWTIRNAILYSDAQEQRLPADFAKELCDKFFANIDNRLNTWLSHEVIIKPHELFVRKAIEQYTSGDFVSCISVLYPRIEGIMRTLHLAKNTNPSQSAMADTAVERIPDFSALLPARFRQFLLAYYFRNFNQSAGEVPLSRHTVAHGISDAADYDQEKAAIGFMIIDQLSYCLASWRR